MLLIIINYSEHKMSLTNRRDLYGPSISDTGLDAYRIPDLDPTEELK